MHGRFGSQMDMAEVKHSEWCRKEIDLAYTDLAAAASNGLQPAARNNRYVDNLSKRQVQIKLFHRE